MRFRAPRRAGSVAADADAAHRTAAPQPAPQPAPSVEADVVADVEAVDPFASLPRAQPGHATVRYRGSFEGLWTDRSDAEEVLARRRRAQQFLDGEEDLVRHWLEHGYVILPGAVDGGVC